MSARVVVDEDARTVTTTFDDGSRVIAAPQVRDEDLARATALGYCRVPYFMDTFEQEDAEAVWSMTRDHDRLHTLLAEAQGYPVSLALWFAAHPDEEMRAADRVMAALEERTVLLVQRLLQLGLDELWAERESAQRANDGERAA